MSAVLGTCLLDPEAESAGPNLMERLVSDRTEPLLPALTRALWPIAATLLVAIGAYGWVAAERAGCETLREQIAQYDEDRTQARHFQMQTAKAIAEERYLKNIAASLSNPSWQVAVERIGHCMPEDIWLEHFDTLATGEITLAGAGYSEDAINEFVGWLRKTPGLTDVALDSTQKGRGRTDRLVNFTVQCKFTDQPNSEGGGDNVN